MAPKRKMTGNGHPSKRVKTSKKTWRKKSSGEELKFFDTALSFTCDATGEVPATGQLALIPQGYTESTRDGRKATIKSIWIRGQLNFCTSTAATAAGVVYISVVQINSVIVRQQQLLMCSLAMEWQRTFLILIIKIGSRS